MVPSSELPAGDSHNMGRKRSNKARIHNIAVAREAKRRKVGEDSEEKENILVPLVRLPFKSPESLELILFRNSKTDLMFFQPPFDAASLGLVQHNG